MTKNTEENLKRKRINPYLFFLLVEMLEFEAEVPGEQYSVVKIQEYVYQKKLNKVAFPNTIFKWKKKNKDEKDPRDGDAAKIANAMKRCFLIPQEDLITTIKQRDHLAQLISKLGQFNSWADFENKYKDDYGAISCERWRTMKYAKLPLSLKGEIEVWVTERVSNLKLKYSLSGKSEGKAFRNIHINTGKFAIRNTEDYELSLVSQYAEKVYDVGLSLNGYKVKKSWFDVNPNIIYGNFNSYRMLEGNVNLLPIKEACYIALKENRKYETEIKPEDIYAMSEAGRVKHIYIEGLACENNTVFASFVHKFREMLATICDTDNEELIICSIGGSKDGNKLMDGCKFSKDEKVISTDSITGKSYLFREVKWKKLQKRLEHVWNKLDDKYRYYGRLKPIKK